MDISKKKLSWLYYFTDLTAEQIFYKIQTVIDIKKLLTADWLDTPEEKSSSVVNCTNRKKITTIFIFVATKIVSLKKYWNNDA